MYIPHLHGQTALAQDQPASHRHNAEIEDCAPCSLSTLEPAALRSESNSIELSIVLVVQNAVCASILAAASRRCTPPAATEQLMITAAKACIPPSLGAVVSSALPECVTNRQRGGRSRGGQPTGRRRRRCRPGLERSWSGTLLRSRVSLAGLEKDVTTANLFTVENTLAVRSLSVNLDKKLFFFSLGSR